MAKVVNKTDVKTIVLVAVGVFVAGLAMFFGRNVSFVRNATKGFDN